MAQWVHRSTGKKSTSRQIPVSCGPGQALSHRKPAQLSGGMRQRLSSIATGAVAQTSRHCYCWTKPFGALDALTRGVAERGRAPIQRYPNSLVKCLERNSQSRSLIDPCWMKHCFATAFFG